MLSRLCFRRLLGSWVRTTLLNFMLTVVLQCPTFGRQYCNGGVLWARGLNWQHWCELLSHLDNLPVETWSISPLDTFTLNVELLPAPAVRIYLDEACNILTTYSLHCSIWEGDLLRKGAAYWLVNLPRPVDSGPQSPPPPLNVPMDLFLKECTWFQREGLGSHWSLIYPFMPPPPLLFTYTRSYTHFSFTGRVLRTKNTNTARPTDPPVLPNPLQWCLTDIHNLIK